MTASQVAFTAALLGGLALLVFLASRIRSRPPGPGEPPDVSGIASG
jgi:hypothetical protein